MGLAEAFGFGVAGDAQKYIIGIGEAALEVSLVDDDFVFLEKLLNAGQCLFVWS